jgi:hypothetical protein
MSESTEANRVAGSAGRIGSGSVRFSGSRRARGLGRDPAGSSLRR